MPIRYLPHTRFGRSRKKGGISLTPPLQQLFLDGYTPDGLSVIDSQGLQNADLQNSNSVTVTTLAVWTFPVNTDWSSVENDGTAVPSIVGTTIVFTGGAGTVYNLVIKNVGGDIIDHVPCSGSDTAVEYETIRSNNPTLTNTTRATIDNYHYNEINGGGKHYDYNGLNAYQTITDFPSELAHTTGTFTVNIAFYIKNLIGTQQVIYSRKLNNSQGYSFGINSAANAKLLIYFNTSFVGYSTANILSDNSMNYASFVISNTAGTVTYSLFLNGVSIATTQVSSTDHSETGGATNTISLGELTSGSAPYYSYLSEISDFNDVAFDLADHNEWYNAGSPTNPMNHSEAANLYHYWKDEGTDVIRDQKNSVHLLADNLDNFAQIPTNSLGVVNALGFINNKPASNFYKGFCDVQVNPDSNATLITAGYDNTVIWTWDDLDDHFGNQVFVDRSNGYYLTDHRIYSAVLTDDLAAVETQLNITKVPTVILKGQSNALGTAAMAGLTATYAGEIANANVYTKQGFELLNSTLNNNQYTSAGNTFGTEMSMMYTLASLLGNVNLLKYSIGGSYLAVVALVDWNTANVGELLDLSQTVMQNAILISKADNNKLQIIYHLWYQGEADSTAALQADAYAVNIDLLWTDEKAFYGTFGNVDSSVLKMISVLPQTDKGAEVATVRAAIIAFAGANADVGYIDADSYGHSGVHLTDDGYEDLGLFIANNYETI